MKKNNYNNRLALLSEKYRRLRSRLQKAMQNERFRQFATHKQQQLLRLLTRYERQLRRLGYACALSTPLFLAPAAAEAQTPVGSEFQVNTYTISGQSTPSVAIDNDGDFVVAWQSYGQDGDGYGIYAQRYANTGAPVGSEFQVNSYTTSYQRNPSIAIDSDGDFVVAWQSLGQDGYYEGIYAQRYDNAGTPVGSEFQVNSYTTSSQQNPSVAMDSDGGFVVAWDSYGQDGNSWGVYAQRYDNMGAAVGSEFQVNSYTTSYQQNPSVAMDSDGDFVVAWHSIGQDGSFWGIYAQRYDNMGTPVGSEFLVNTHTTSSQRDPSVAIDSDGDFVVAWHSIGQDGSGYGIYAQRYDNMGAAVGSEFQVNTYTSNSQLFPSIAIDSDGDFVVAWQSHYQDGAIDGIYAQQYDNTGAAVGSEFLVNTYTTSDQQKPSVAIDSDGDFVVAWHSTGQDGHFYGIYAQQYAAASSAVVPSASGSEFQVNTYTTNHQVNPSVAIDSDGDFVVVWQSNDQDGDLQGIYAQRYDNTGAAVGSEFQVNTYTTNSQRNPSVAINSDGDFVVAWQSYGQDGDHHGIYAQRFNNTGAAVGSEFLVNTHTTNSQSDPSVAIDSDGDFVVAWTNYDQGSIYAQRYNNMGAAVGSEFLVNTYTTNTQFNASIAMNSDGDFVVAWTSYDQDGSYYGIYAQRYDNMGAAVGSEFQVNTYTTSYQRNPSVAIDSDGDFVVAWTSYYQDGSSVGIYAQRYDNMGAAVGSEFQVNTYTTSSQSAPSVAIDSDGDFMVTWMSSGQDGSNYGIYAQQYDKTGTAVGSEFLVNTYTTSEQKTPSVAIDSDGDFIVAWTSNGQDGDGYGIYAQQYAAASAVVPSASGSEFQVNTYTANGQKDPSVAIDSDGDFVVVWESSGQDGNYDGIYAQRYDKTGVAVGSEFLVNTYTTSDQRNLSVAIDSDGDFVVAWMSYGQDGDTWGIYAQQYDNTGAAVGSEFQVNTYTTDNQLNPSVAIDSDGDFVVAWHSDGQDGSNDGIYAQRYDKTGAAVGSEFLVNTHTTNEQSDPSVAIDSDGDFVVAWMSDGQDGSGYGIYAQRYDKTGATVGSEFQVNSYTTFPQRNPSVAIDSDGDFVVAWESFGQDGSNDGIYAQRYDKMGAAVGSEFLVNTYTTSSQSVPSVAIDSDGDFVVAWYSFGQDGDSFGVYAQQYDNTGAAVGSEFLVNTYTTSSQFVPSVAIDSDGDFVVAWYSFGQDGDGYGIYAQRYANSVPPSISCGPTAPLPTAAGTYTGAVATADADGFTYYCDGSGNLLLAIKTPANDWVIPADAVQLKIGATPVDFYPKFCGATGADRCFVRNNNGAPIVNRYWEIDESKITVGSAAGFVVVKYFFTNAEFLAVNAELTAQGVATLPAVTDLNLYNVNGHLVTTPFPSVTDTKPFQAGIVLKNGATPRPSQWVHSTHGTSDHIATFEIYPTMLNSGGGLGGKLKNN